MPYTASLDYIFKKLQDYQGFPKYALERRLDIFLTPFLPAFISKKYGGEATLVAPEFPILSALLDLKPDQAPGKRFHARTVNLDYLFHVRAKKPCWVFLELKTDPRSNRDEQVERYRHAKQRGMLRLMNDIEFVEGKTKGLVNKGKYQRALAALKDVTPATDLIELAYLSPTEPPAVSPDLPSDERELPIKHLPLRAFAEGEGWQRPTEHNDLWKLVSKLVLDLPH